MPAQKTTVENTREIPPLGVQERDWGKRDQQARAMRKGARLRSLVDAVVREWLQGAESSKEREDWWAKKLIVAIDKTARKELSANA